MVNFGEIDLTSRPSPNSISRTPFSLTMKFIGLYFAFFTILLTGCCTMTPHETIPVTIVHITVRAVKKDMAGHYVDLPGYSAALIGSGGPPPLFAKSTPVVPGGTTLMIPAVDIRPTPDSTYPANSYIAFSGDPNQGAPVGISQSVYLTDPSDQEYDFVFDLPAKTVSIHHHKN